MLPAFFRQHSRLVLGFLILTFPVLLVTSESLTSNNDIETWLPEKAPVRQVYDGFKDRFGAEELVLVGLPGEDTKEVVDEELVDQGRPGGREGRGSQAARGTLGDTWS